MATNGRTQDEDKMVTVMEQIAKDLEKVVFWLVISAAFLALIAFTIILRTMIGR